MDKIKTYEQVNASETVCGMINDMFESFNRTERRLIRLNKLMKRAWAEKKQYDQLTNLFILSSFQLSKIFHRLFHG